MGLFLSHQTGEPSAVPPNLTARALHGPIGSSSAGPKPLEGKAAAAHVDYSMLCCVVCCDLSEFSYHTGSNTILAKSKWPSFACSYHKIGPQTPQI
jgi:hypothetical protein